MRWSEPNETFDDAVTRDTDYQSLNKTPVIFYPGPNPARPHRYSEVCTKSWRSTRPLGILIINIIYVLGIWLFAHHVGTTMSVVRYMVIRVYVYQYLDYIGGLLPDIFLQPKLSACVLHVYSLCKGRQTALQYVYYTAHFFTEDIIHRWPGSGLNNKVLKKLD
ncbi:hypothetical protein GGS20DRAFT_286169 [Poronia punctata]|nr:hypothetical protein GGS20DRAFT_286169 [Poronia punctata]